MTMSDYFNPRSLTGATGGRGKRHRRRYNFNPRSLTGATVFYNFFKKFFGISIHAPSRERHALTAWDAVYTLFQSTLPHGSDI